MNRTEKKLRDDPEARLYFYVQYDPPDSFYGTCRQLKGCHSQGNTLEEAIRNVANAAIAYLRSLDAEEEP